MIGTVVLSHGNIGTEMVRIAKSIVSDANPMVGLSLRHNEDVQQVRQRIADAIHELNRGRKMNGTLILCDMFGATPSNLCLSFLKEGEVEVVTGMNLPMVIKLASFREDKTLSDMATFIRNYGQKNITRASEVVKGHGNTG